MESQLKQVSENLAKAATEASLAERVAELKEYAKTSAEQEGSRVRDLSVTSTSELQGAIDALRTEVLERELPKLTERLTLELENTRHELSAQAERWAKEAADVVETQRRELSAALEKASSEAQAAREDLRETTGKQVKQMEAELAKAKELAEARKEEADLKEGEFHLKFDRLADRVKDLETTVETLVRKDDMETSLKGMDQSVDKRLVHLEQELPRVTDAVAEVENISTRRVDWIIQKASQKLRPPRTSKAQLHASYFSPRFCCSGVSGLQLELQMFRKGDPPVAGESEGDCAVFLWATKGLNITYKLSVAGKTVELQKAFNGRVPYGTQRFCFVKDQIHRETDTLQVSVEILEIVKQVDHVVTNPEPAPAEEPAEGEEELPADKRPLDCTVRFRKNVNNRILDQVRHQVDLMRSRMVRKVEWRVEQASMLRRCFPEGEPICSTAFSAAGIEGLQLIFYPSGYEGATPGFCSFFVYAPAGATLRCSLTAGGQRREAHHSFEDAGAFGRTNFCRLEGVIEDDTVLLGIEIEEAHQDLQAKVAHPTVQPGDARTLAQIEGTVPTAVNSVVKLQRAPGKSLKGMDDFKVLPSLWTAKPLTERGAANEKPRAFEDFSRTGVGAVSPLGASMMRPGSSPGPGSPTSKLLPELSKDGCSPDKAKRADRMRGRGRGGVRSTSAL